MRRFVPDARRYSRLSFADSPAKIVKAECRDKSETQFPDLLHRGASYIRLIQSKNHAPAVFLRRMTVIAGYNS